MICTSAWRFIVLVDISLKQNLPGPLVGSDHVLASDYLNYYHICIVQKYIPTVCCTRKLTALVWRLIGLGTRIPQPRTEVERQRRSNSFIMVEWNQWGVEVVLNRIQQSGHVIEPLKLTFGRWFIECRFCSSVGLPWSRSFWGYWLIWTFFYIFLGFKVWNFFILCRFFS